MYCIFRKKKKKGCIHNIKGTKLSKYRKRRIIWNVLKNGYNLKFPLLEYLKMWQMTFIKICSEFNLCLIQFSCVYKILHSYREESSVDHNRIMAQGETWVA